MTLTLGMTALVSPSGAAAQHRAGADPVTLTFLNAYTGSQVTALQNTIIPKFERENPGIKVTNISVPYSDLLKKYLAEAAAGNPPDVLRSDIAWMAELAGDGTALQVNKLSWYTADGIAKSSLPGPLLTTEYKGNAYGLPLDTNTTALFWNKTDFAAAGISSPPKTIPQLIADAKKLTIASKDQYGFGVDSTDIWDVSPFIWSVGGGFTNGSYTTASGFMDSSATRYAVSLLASGYDGGHGWIGPDIISTTGDSGEQEFPLGKYAMYIDGPWAVATYAALKPVPDYGIEAFPTGRGGSHTPTGGEDLVISKGGHNLADAELFAQFLTEPFAQLVQAKVGGEMSSYSTDSAAEVKATPYYAVFASALQNAKVRPVTQYYGLLDTDFSNAFEEILAGKETVSAGLAQATQQSDAALAGKG
ncbi:MAG TPA: extracellular solute-binding protein [Acidimicrobiales bacterium]|nr:extracellular solute-binding protein [Acidimicrobiales bacterium]